ncbi:MAG: hypothetical protein EP321_09270 [Sphingomonadales bacterium]|nr:MAG: hypothetical protein EP345_08480 [Sphingomonadales bacterium]TNF03846.1 MAG: hypothetical protein EP321_09270 [Sphingomonadales bacterium]
MPLIVNLLLLIPSLIAGWFVSKEDPRYWVIALVIALVFLALSIVAAMYIPSMRIWPRNRK